MIDLRTARTEGDCDTVPGRRCSYPGTPARPAALLKERCLQVAFDPSTGEYRIAIR